MFYIQAMEFYRPLKNEVISFAGKWAELEIIVLNEMSWTQKDKHCMQVLHVALEGCLCAMTVEEDLCGEDEENRNR